MHYDVIIVGAGPGGLACGAELAQKGLTTLIVERKSSIGPKSCAGGITCSSGLLERTPAQIVERAFSHQYVNSRWQTIRIVGKKPIIATVNREKYGQYMADLALLAGAHIKLSASVDVLSSNSIVLRNHLNSTSEKITYNYLVGADGSTSKVRRYLGLPIRNMGLGLNYQLDQQHEKMEWHLNSRFFNNGYGWIFPHKNSISIGAYSPGHTCCSAAKLKYQLQNWAQQQGFQLATHRCTAGYINYDYQGHCFDNIFLIGDAAGLASALTGEGIYPAIVSGIAVAKIIATGKKESEPMTRLIRKQRRFQTIVKTTGKNSLISTILAELGLLGLRLKLINFTMLEMGGK